MLFYFSLESFIIKKYIPNSVSLIETHLILKMGMKVNAQKGAREWSNVWR